MAFFALSLIGQAQTAYRAKVYPQQQETCGTASISHDGNTYTLSNALFAATFRHEGDKLYFDGSEALGLLDGTELFTLRLGTESKVVNASEMTLVSVEDRKLTGSDTAVKGSHHFDGVELVATYNYTYKTSKITAVWRAELRDGSHYLKTDLTLSADKDTRFTSITPLQYEYNAAEFDAPVAGGNTRGSVFLNDHIFFGLETPMGVQSAKFHGEADGSEFSPRVGRRANLSPSPAPFPKASPPSATPTTRLLKSRATLPLPRPASRHLPSSSTAATSALTLPAWIL